MTADCVLLDGDPLADIEALNTANLVVRQGRVVYARPTNAPFTDT
jgi:imidazolonepropionase-like amidohydrolase